MSRVFNTKENIRWNDLIGCDYGFNSTILMEYNGSSVDENRAIMDLKSGFHMKKGVVDYIDPNETENTLISVDSKSLMPVHTHLEIHSSLILGLMSNLIVFPENNPPNRNTFSFCVSFSVSFFIKSYHLFNIKI